MYITAFFVVAIVAWTIRYIVLPYRTIKKEIQFWASKGLKVYQLPLALIHSSFFSCIFRSQRLNGDPFHTIKTQMRGYDIAVGNYGTKPAILLLSAPIHQELYLQNHLVKKPLSIHFHINKISGKGLLMSYGEQWKTKRMIFTRAFSFDFLINLTPTMGETFQKAIDQISLNVKNSKSNQAVDLITPIERALVEVIIGFFFGIDMTKEMIQDKPIGEFVANIFEEGLARTRSISFGLLGSWIGKLRILKADRDYQDRVTIQRSVAKQLINRRLEELDKGEDNRMSILNQLHKDDLINRDPLKVKTTQSSTQNKQKIDIDELVDELNTFILAGTDTTANSVNTTLHLLNENPACLQKVLAEIEKHAHQPLDFTTLKKHFYLDAVFKQSLRLYNPAMRIFLREVAPDSPFNLQGNPCKDGSLLLLTTATLHLDKSVYPCPDDYFPERWLGVDPKLNSKYSPTNKASTSVSNDQSVSKQTDSLLTNQSTQSCPFSSASALQTPSLDPDFRLPLPHTYSYCPFSGGQRNCIGQYLARIQFKLIMITMFRKWKKIENQMPRRMELSLTYGCLNRSFWLEQAAKL